jgi:SAM-dependent methyltransferase
MHGNSLEVFRRIGLPFFQPGMDVLEVGPDSPGWCRTLVMQAGVRYHHADCTNIGRGQGGFVAMHDAYRVDCPENSFEVVFSANVVEHVPRVWRWLAELTRITRPGGLVLCVNPVSWPYHEAPVDCWR